jgi:hypothetical protein
MCKDLNTTLAFTVIILMALALKSIVYFFRQRAKKASKNIVQTSTNTTTKKIYSILHEPADAN